MARDGVDRSVDDVLPGAVTHQPGVGTEPVVDNMNNNTVEEEEEEEEEEVYTVEVSFTWALDWEVMSL